MSKGDRLEEEFKKIVNNLRRDVEDGKNDEEFEKKIFFMGDDEEEPDTDINGCTLYISNLTSRF